MSVPQRHYRETYERHSDSLPGAGVSWLTRLRDRAMMEFQQRPFPDTRIEAWKYTDLRSLNRHLFTPARAGATVAAATLQGWLFGNTPMHRLVFVDGHYTPLPGGASGPLPDGVRLTSLASALEQQPAALESVLGCTLTAERPGFDAMNTAFLQDGAWLRLQSGVVLEHPLHLLFINTGQAQQMVTLRNIIQAGPGSSATVIESWLALDDAAGLTNTITEIVLGTGAALDHYKLEQEAASATHVGGLYVRQGRNSRLNAHSIALGGQLVRNDLRISLDGAGATCALNGLSFTRNRQHLDNHIRIDHNVPDAGSDAWYRGILADRSRTVFSGRIVVHKDAQQTRAQLSNHSLLLSGEAEADARPQFEIYADDVQCRHGCTVGELDPDALFYLRSRALDEATAQRLLIRAFAAEAIGRMRQDCVRDYLERQLAGCLDICKIALH